MDRSRIQALTITVRTVRLPLINNIFTDKLIKMGNFFTVTVDFLNYLCD